MKISLIQIESGEDKEANFEKAKKYLVEVAKKGSDIASLSENFLYRGNDKKKEVEELSSSYIKRFQELAKEYKLNIILGSIALKSDQEDRVTNSCLVLDRGGKIIHRYDKIYMYDVEREDLNFHESDGTIPGTKLGIFQLEGVRMGVGICVDLRYPEYFRELTKQGAEIIFLPSNFRKITGQLAWDVLTKARAIENQIYFCACGQTGGEGVLERCGNSQIISYDGKVISEIGEEEGIVSAELDLDAQRKFRKEFPVLRQIRY